MQEGILRDPVMSPFTGWKEAGGPGKEMQEIIISDFIDLLRELKELSLFSPTMFSSVPGT